ncbi:chitin disaccharide deacetylase [Proteus hauseri]|uniref:chitin disaccharide deacetylase n=1 Tax=Proteus hauseri TaxID=183417 RepID=UPI0010097FF8|nr:chitin disaccharide deacetylase [Proteus hauseri]QAV22982.1 chitin disaccharide deacetylase [Proteus hauseri]
MARLLIVNADDFGLSKGQNYGIAECHRYGVVTSTTALVNAEGIEHAAQLRKELPNLGVGLHFTLTMGKPLSPLSSLTRDGVLGKWVWQMAEEGDLPLDEIRIELQAQYQRFIDIFACEPDHIDSHHHVHMFKQIFPIVAEFAKEKSLPLRVDRPLAKQDSIETQGVLSSDGFDSQFYGDEISQALFLKVLDESLARKEHSLEVMTHPAFIDNPLRASGYCFQRLAELEVLTELSLKKAIVERGYQLGTYQNLI